MSNHLELLQAYELVEERMLKDVGGKGVFLRHKKSGAKIALLLNDDDNKVFQIAFRTPPSNQKGIPHILEHAVFCGSRKFPVKDPFVELAKGSLNTFLNAMTYPDKTVFPVASQNEKDFQNLMDVYLDGVFYPNLYAHEEIFWQEGWSYGIDPAKKTLSYNGVVYNEMKGACSSPEDRMSRESVRALFPNNCYVNEAGGLPEEIIKLTYEECIAYHRTYYHPSNSYMYLYGNIDAEQKLLWLDREYLSHFSKRQIDSSIPIEKPFEKRREVEAFYGIGKKESEEERTYLSYNKVIGTTMDPKLYMAFQVLEYVLFASSGAPVLKALLEAGIGKDVDGFYDTTFQQPVFSVIARDVDRNRKDDFVWTVEEVFRRLVEKGIDAKALEAGIHYYEFRLHEADGNGDPQGLLYGLQMLESWLYDDEKPFLLLELSDILEELRGEIHTGYFEKLLKMYVLDNNHDAVVVLSPKAGLQGEQDEKEEQSLLHYKEALSKEQWNQLLCNANRLKTYQEAEESQEALKSIPILCREDLRKEILPIANEEKRMGDIPVVFHEIETKGIGYVTLLFDITDIPEGLLPYVGLLQAILGVVDTKYHSYGDFYNEIHAYTGGMETSLEVYPDVTRAREKAFRATFEISGKSFYRNISVLIHLMQEMICETIIDDRNRLQEIIEMIVSQMQTDLLEEGHAIATMRAFSYHSPIARWKELTAGISFYEEMKAIDVESEDGMKTCIHLLKSLLCNLFRKERMQISYTATKEGLPFLKESLENFHVMEGDKIEFPKRMCKKLSCSKEMIPTSSYVQFVAQTGNFIDAGYSYHGAMQILKEILNYDYLWLHVRAKGGAYGVSCSFNRIGEGYFASYRDPNLTRTLEIYKGVPEYIRSFQATEKEMTKYIIGTMSNMDRPLSPAAKGERSMNLYMNHITEEMLKKERQEILQATAKDIRSFADGIEALLKEEDICIIGNERVLESEKNTLKSQMTML